MAKREMWERRGLRTLSQENKRHGLLVSAGVVQGRGVSAVTIGCGGTLLACGETWVATSVVFREESRLVHQSH